LEQAAAVSGEATIENEVKMLEKRLRLSS